jgi:5-methylcytosine-specific restriction protein A
MPRALRVCSVSGCPNLTPQGRCDTHRAQAEGTRGTSRQRGYGRTHQARFRPQVLKRDPLCVCQTAGHGHTGPCLAPSTVADHHPLSRRDLVARGMDADDPRHGRGLCAPCHNRETATRQPGGWHGV